MNRLLLRDRRKDPWGNVNARIIWESGGQSAVWVNSNGTGEFNGNGIISFIRVPGEDIDVAQKVDGNSSIVVVSRNAH